MKKLVIVLIVSMALLACEKNRTCACWVKFTNEQLGSHPIHTFKTKPENVSKVCNRRKAKWYGDRKDVQCGMIEF